jgi:hypothetical protein
MYLKWETTVENASIQMLTISQKDNHLSLEGNR